MARIQPVSRDSGWAGTRQSDLLVRFNLALPSCPPLITVLARNGREEVAQDAAGRAPSRKVPATEAEQPRFLIWTPDTGEHGPSPGQRSFLKGQAPRSAEPVQITSWTNSKAQP